MISWWKARHGYGCGTHAQAGGGGGHEDWSAAPDDGDYGGGGFGVRRPLRFLAHKLQLTEPQVADLAAILNELKTERAQAAVDDRRARAAFADLIAADTLDAAKVDEAAKARVKGAERVAAAVARALGRIHALLNPQQRAQLAYLIRTGTLMI
jgi:Spy/CpxP family protein refolding chaperone